MTSGGRSLRRPLCPGLLLGARGLLLALAALVAGGQTPLTDGQLRDFRAAEADLEAGRYSEAAQGYAALAAVLPDEPELHAKLGFSHFLGRSCGRAAPAFRRALELRPDLRAARVLLSICLSELGRYSDAIAGLEEGYADPPDYPGVKRLAGLELVRSYLGLRRHAHAANVMAELQIAHPEDPEILFHANRTYREVAIRAAFEIARVAPDSVWGHQAMGEAYEGRQFYDLAVMEYRKALEIEPGRPGLRYRLGEALLASAGDPAQADDALRQFEMELADNPSHAGAAMRAGEIHYAKSRLEDALGYLERAVELRPDFPDARLSLGRVLSDLGRLEDSRTHLERAVELDPANASVRYQLAQVCRKLGDSDAQRVHLAEYRRLQAERRDLDRHILQGSPDAGRDAGQDPASR